MTESLPDPAVVVLVGVSGSGKSVWARSHYRSQEVIASDELRAVVGSGPHDLDASADAFGLLDDILAARAGRGLTCVVDTLGLDTARRLEYLAVARRNSIPAIAVFFDTPPELARRRNADRDRPVPASALAGQLSRAAAILPELQSEGWDRVVVVPGGGVTAAADSAAEAGNGHQAADSEPRAGVRGAASGAGLFVDRGEPAVILQLSRFDWGNEDPATWLTQVALAADGAGFAGIALMDHLIQIPQVDRAWAPIPEPWVTLGMLAGLPTSLLLGTLVSPVTFRPAGITAKTVATLDVISGGRAFLGIGAGWWEREHAAFGLPFPDSASRLDALARAVDTIRALWATGTKPYRGDRISLPETTCYPRPLNDPPIIVGGSGRRTLGIAARLADGCNVSSRPEVLFGSIDIFREQCVAAGRDLDAVLITVLDLPVTGRTREEVWDRVERWRGRTAAAQFARTHNAGTHVEHRDRLRRLGESGVRTVFLSPVGQQGPDEIAELAPLVPT